MSVSPMRRRTVRRTSPRTHPPRASRGKVGRTSAAEGPTKTRPAKTHIVRLSPSPSLPPSSSPLFLSQLISPSHSDTDTDPIIHSQLPRRLVHLRPALPRALIDHRRHGACRSLLVHAIGPRHASHPRRRHLRRALRRHPQLRAGDRRR